MSTEHHDGHDDRHDERPQGSTVYVAHAPLPDDDGAEVAAHRAFEVVLNLCTCPTSAVLVLRHPSGRPEALEHHHTDPACVVVLGATHPELRTTP